MSVRDQLLDAYRCAANGNEAAFTWLVAFHGWCHRIDDFVDDFRERVEAVDLCADGVTLFAAEYFRDRCASLAPVVAAVAEQYRYSLQATGQLSDALRIAGNQVVLVVAYLEGGNRVVREVSKKLWPIVIQSQLR